MGNREKDMRNIALANLIVVTVFCIGCFSTSVQATSVGALLLDASKGGMQVSESTVNVIGRVDRAGVYKRFGYHQPYLIIVSNRSSRGFITCMMDGSSNQAYEGDFVYVSGKITDIKNVGDITLITMDKCKKYDSKD